MTDDLKELFRIVRSIESKLDRLIAQPVTLKRKMGRPRKEIIERGPEPDYLTIDEFMAMFAVTRKSWPRHRPFVKTVVFGGRTLIKREEVMRYIASLEKPAQRKGHAKGVAPPPVH